MDSFATETLEAMLVEATSGVGGSDDPSVASRDELDVIGMRTAGDDGVEATAGTTTEPCQKTCGGCRG